MRRFTRTERIQQRTQQNTTPVQQTGDATALAAPPARLQANERAAVIGVEAEMETELEDESLVSEEEMEEEILDEEELEEEEGEDEGDEEEVEEEEGEEGEEGEEEVSEDDGQAQPAPMLPPPPPNTREISSLASFTVSTSKPHCGISSLLHPSTALFWQSDGPQPHLLNIHFFKLVSIVAIRLYLDFQLDESYTPTKISFWAGTGQNDLQEWAVMAFEQPKGWVDVDFSGVGRYESASSSASSDSSGSSSPTASDAADDTDDDDEDIDIDPEQDPEAHAAAHRRRDRRRRRRERRQRREKRMPLLRAFLVQIRILENHQNGKDTHLRGLQIYARDRAVKERGISLKSGRKSDVGGVLANGGTGGTAASGAKSGKGKAREKRIVPVLDWGDMPELR